MPTFKPPSLLFLCLLAAGLTACAPLATLAEPPPAGPGALVIYSGRSESLVDPVIQMFADATGVEVRVRYGSTAEMAATLLEEGARSPADVFFAQDPGGLGAVAEAGLLAPLPAEVLSRVDPRFASPQGVWVGVSGRARVVVYNTERVNPSDLPDGLSGFSEPAWRGRIGLPPTNASFQTMVTALRRVWGEEQARAWLVSLRANEPVFYDNNTAVVAAVGAGEVDVGLVNHYYLYRFLAEQGESFPARNAFLPDGGPGSLVMVAGAGRLAGGSNEANALKFLEFLLSVVAQQYFASSTYEYPLVEGVGLEPGLTPLAELDAPNIPLGDLADLEGTVRLLQETGFLP
jgi:iron(III) transport system substrate-binding protein